MFIPEETVRVRRMQEALYLQVQIMAEQNATLERLKAKKRQFGPPSADPTPPAAEGPLEVGIALARDVEKNLGAARLKELRALSPEQRRTVIDAAMGAADQIRAEKDNEARATHPLSSTIH